MLELGTSRVSAGEATGIVGARQLVCVQTFDIARLTTHPVVLVPGSFVAVGGRGPRGDSNESGKTSFLAATSLLLGDPEWRMGGGGPAATAALLFEPETAGVSAHTYGAASRGYVIGVFADPEHPANTSLTVWCRINTTNPHFQVRHAVGVHLVDGDNNPERYRRVEEVWSAMPASTELGARTYAERLYGDSPRCLAYVARRGKQRSAPSLLQMNAGGFSPEQIGEDLIRLTGRAAAFETEGHQRQRLDEAQRALEEKQRDNDRARRDEQAQLEGVLARNASRAHLDEAQRIWRLHFARGYLDVLARETELGADRDEAREQAKAHAISVSEGENELNRLRAPEELRSQHDNAEREASRLEDEMAEAKKVEVEARVAVDAASNRVAELDEAADGWTTPALEAVTGRLSEARVSAEEAQQLVGSAKTASKNAKNELLEVEKGTQGSAGRAVELLRDHGVEAAPLFDVELADTARAAWESRLYLYEAAVVVAPGQMNEALSAAATAPGTMLIAGKEGELPEGIASAPRGAAWFLARLAVAAPVDTNPVRSEHQELGIVVIGDFAEPQTGHAARLERARKDLAEAERLLRDAAGAARAAALEVERLEGDLVRARAAEDLVKARESLRKARQDAATAQKKIDELVEPLAAAKRQYVVLAARLEGYEQALKAAEDTLAARKNQHRDATEKLNEAQRRLDALQVDFWRSSWGESAGAAETALADEGRIEKTLRNRAAELLLDALGDLHIKSDGSGAPTEQLAQVARRRSLLGEDPERGRVPARLEEVAGPLRDFLDGRHDQDLVVEERVTRAREQRGAELELAVSEVEQLDSALETLQDGVEQRIRQALEAISEQYDRLNRESGWFGADLHIEARRPEGPTQRWRWLVTPRWRRSANGRPLPYDNQANTAQEKLATVQLVLAALLAAPNPHGRVLVLDELGDSLGVSHRREVLREIAATAEAKRVTVLGTCQDSVMADAAEQCGELIYFDYPSHEDALNRPTRMFGFDQHRDRVELTADALRSGRPVV